MTDRIRDFLRVRRELGRDEGPVMVLDLDVVRDNYTAFARALPDTRVFYAVKANPAPEVLRALAEMGSCFDTASVVEIQMALAAGATADRVSFGNTIKKERCIARALQLGVRLFAVDCQAEVDKIARAADAVKVAREDVQVFCRILCDGAGRRVAALAQVRLRAGDGGGRARARHPGGPARLRRVVPCRLAAGQHGSWDGALASAAMIFRECAHRGIHLSMVNLGGGFPTKYLKAVPGVESYGDAIFRALTKHFGNQLPETIIEPGRGMVGNAGVIEAEVVLVSQKSDAADEVRWVYLDIGKFGGLAETMDESIRYRIVTEHDEDRTIPCVLAGRPATRPTCSTRRPRTRCRSRSPSATRC